MVGVERVLQIMAYFSAVVGVLPVLTFLDSWVLLTLLGALLLGIAGDRRGRYLLSKGLATLLSIAFFGLFSFQVSLNNLVEPLIQLLCLLLAVRLASDKSPRHLLQLFLLSTMVLAASSMLTLDMAYLVYLVLIVLLVTSGLVLLSFYATDPRIRFTRQQWLLLLKVIAWLPVGSLLLMLVLFVILPRTQMPMWDFLNPHPAASIGMSDQVHPGSVAELAQSAQTAFRAEAKRLPVNSLYWRGIVLNQLNGQTWTRSAGHAKEKLISDSESEILLTIYSEPKAERYLVTLDHPRQVAQVRHDLAPDGVVTGRWREDRRIRYQVRAQYSAHSQQIGSVDSYLQLPDNLSQQLRAIGVQISAGKNYQGKVDLLEKFFLQQQLSYSITQLPATDNPIDTFLFDSRRGYCEYFASSFAVLLRLAGVPTRLVGGYLGGEFNQFGGYYLVGEDSAHVWVEALDDSAVWQRIDPSRLAINADQAFSTTGLHGLATLQALTDALLHNWSSLVLNYDLRQQFGLFRQAAEQVRGLKDFDSRILWRLFWLLPFLLPFVLLSLKKHRSGRSERLLKAYRQQVAKCTGLDSLPAMLGLFELARLSAEPLCREFAEIYGAAIYRDQSLSATELLRLKQIISQLSKRRFAIVVAMPLSLEDNTTTATLH